MITVAEARRRILEGVAALPGERVALVEAHGRVLARDLTARLTQPPFDTTAMDGYAVRAYDAKAGTRLAIIGESSAGRRFDGSVVPGTAVRIFTGAPLPHGADAVLPQEVVTRDAEVAIPREDAVVGRFIRPAGLDFEAGAVALRAGRVLDPRAIALAAAMNRPTIEAVRRPRVALLPTGDELVPIGARPGPDQIIASSVHSVAGVARSAGAEVVDLGIAADRDDILDARIAAAIGAGADVLVTLGGASVGDRDLVKGAFAREGMRLGFWSIAMRPGKPLVFGTFEHTRVLGLPGNPVSSFACAVLFLVPLLRALQGLPAGPSFTRLPLAADVGANGDREDYLRAKIETAPDDTNHVRPFPRQDSSMQAILAEADGFVLRPIGAPIARAGEIVPFLPFSV